MMAVRNINEEWIERTIEKPEREGIDPKDKALNFAFRKIVEFDNRWLRVVYRRTEDQVKVITVFFDRGMERSK
jgi:Domain of unknown function (DUF4258)